MKARRSSSSDEEAETAAAPESPIKEQAQLLFLQAQETVSASALVHAWLFAWRPDIWLHEAVEAPVSEAGASCVPCSQYFYLSSRKNLVAFSVGSVAALWATAMLLSNIQGIPAVSRVKVVRRCSARLPATPRGWGT
jgi:hypothetical protein